MDSPPSAIPVAAMICACFYAGLLVRWWVETPSNLPLTKQCVLGLLLGVLPVYIAVAAALESSLGTFAQDPTVQASIPLAGVVVLIIEQGYIWDDAQQHLREQLIKAGDRINDRLKR